MPTESQPRNILFFLTDQQRQNSLGVYDNDVVETPHLDAMARAGIRYDRGYTTTAICTPSRASLLTGQRPSQHGCLANAGHREARPDLSEEPSYPQLLREAGYDVGLVGKWHLPEEPTAFGYEAESYDGWGVYANEHAAYDAYLERNGFEPFERSALTDRFPDDDSEYLIGAVDPRPVEASFPYFLAERAIDRLETAAAGAEPFHLGVHFFGPHNPYFLPREVLDRYDPGDVDLPESAIKETFEDKPAAQRKQLEYSGLQNLPTEDWRRLLAAYWAYVSFIDDQIGRVLEALEDLGVAGETVRAFTSDHGGFATGHKFQDKGPAMYEDIYRVPLVLDAPEVDAGVEDRFVSHLDLAPTFLDVAGVEPPAEMVGQSLHGLATGQVEDWREDVLGEFHGHFFRYQQRMLRTDRYKLVVNGPDQNELYDLAEDPHELENRYRAPGYDEVVDRLTDRLYERLDAIGDDEFPRPGMRK